MDFEEFREKLKEDLGERLFARTGDDFEITSSSATKLQNAGYEGITVRKEGEAVGINLDVADFYKGLESGAADYDSVLDKITEIAIHGFEEAPAFNVSDLGNYEVMKEHLSMQVVQTERNAEMLETIPHVNAGQDKICATASHKFETPPEILISRLSFSHIRKIMSLDDPFERFFYEFECIKGTYLSVYKCITKIGVKLLRKNRRKYISTK